MPVGKQTARNRMNARLKIAMGWMAGTCLMAGMPAVLLSLRPPQSKPAFTEQSAAAGIDFRYNFGDYTYENILESSGSGVSILDIDRDGWMDLYMLNGTWLEGISDPEGDVFRGTPNRLYRNNGDGTFTEMAARAGLDNRTWSMAASTFDYDGDGHTDIYLLNYGPNVFYRNRGDGTFEDITDQLGLQGPDTLNGWTKWSVGAVFWDYNLDGRIDIMVGNFLAFDPDYVNPVTPHLMPHPSEYAGQASMMYRQEHDGRFVDVTRELGLYYPQAKCMGLTLWDYDGDGDLDLFQGNDHQMNFFFRNDGIGRFTEIAARIGVAGNDEGKPTGSMHGSIGDVDGDGLVDLLVSDLEYGCLYRNLGNGFFEDITRRSGIATHFSGKGQWAVNLFDYDNDGDLDIYATCGNGEALVLQYPLLLENDGKGNFRNAGPQLSPYFSEKRSGRASAAWDYDNDGDLDLIVSHIDLAATPALLRNEAGNRNHWIGLSLQGSKGPASASCAVVTLESGTMRQIRVNQWATSYLSYNDPRIHFGLGRHDRVDGMEIKWPDGSVEVYRNVPVDRYHTIRQGLGIQ
jgi:enediyne biosynthesis protein E4